MYTRILLAALLLLVLGPAAAFFEHHLVESQAQKETPGPVPEDVWTTFVTEFQKSDEWRLAMATQSPEFRNKVKASLETRPWHIVETVRNTLTDQDAHYVKVSGSTWVLRSWTERDAGLERRIGTLSVDLKKGPHYSVDAGKLLPLSISYLAAVSLEHPSQKPAPDLGEDVMPGAALHTLMRHMGCKNFAIPVDRDTDRGLRASFKGCTCKEAVEMLCRAAGWTHSFSTSYRTFTIVDFVIELSVRDELQQARAESAEDRILRRLDLAGREYDKQRVRVPDSFSAGPK